MSLPPMDWNHKLDIYKQLKGLCNICGDKNRCEKADCNLYKIKKEVQDIFKDTNNLVAEEFKN